MKTYTKVLVAGLALASGVALSSAAPVAENWDNHCAKCHGADGAGQTKIGKKLKLKNYTDAAVQAAMTDEEILKATTEGVIIDGKEKMKPFKDELSAEEINDFVAYIRAFKS
ncbi:MAG: cytochrome c [Cephaloticoccus sp.]|nr:cytochrome c [Cephaloticoccus sp.]MCF7761381.1 cytochrome c [Cephaloticoccus sp.]